MLVLSGWLSRVWAWIQDRFESRPTPSDLFLELGSLAEELRMLAVRLEALDDRQAAVDLRQTADAAVDPDTRVVVFGEFNVGKSTLINALLGEVVLRSEVRPTTAVAVELRGGRRRAWAKRLADGTVHAITREEFEASETVNADGQTPEAPERLCATVDRPLLRHLVLIDTPGLLDQLPRDDRARREAANADLVVIVVSGRKPWSATERDAAERWLVGALAKPLLVVVNGIGLLAPGDAPVLRQYMEATTKRLSTAWRPGLNLKTVYEVDALPALRWQLLREGGRPRDDFDVFRSVLRQLRGKGGESLSRRSRFHRVDTLLCELRTANEFRIEQWRTSRAAADARRTQETVARDAAVAALEDSLAEFDARLPGERAMLVHEADRFRPGGSRFPTRLLEQRSPDHGYRLQLEKVLRDRAAAMEQSAAACVNRLAAVAGTAPRALRIAPVEIALPPDRTADRDAPRAFADVFRKMTGSTSGDERVDEAHRDTLRDRCRQIADAQDQEAMASLSRVVDGLRSELESKLAAARRRAVGAPPDMPHEIAARIALNDDLAGMIARTRRASAGRGDSRADTGTARIELA